MDIVLKPDDATWVRDFGWAARCIRVNTIGMKRHWVRLIFKKSGDALNDPEDRRAADGIRGSLKPMPVVAR